MSWNNESDHRAYDIFITCYVVVVTPALILYLLTDIFSKINYIQIKTFNLIWRANESYNDAVFGAQYWYAVL